MTRLHLRTPIVGLTATVLTATTLVPLIRGGSWFVAIFAVTATVTAVGIALRTWIRPWQIVTAAQLAALLWIILMLFARDTTVWGVFPGPGSLPELVDLARSGSRTLGQLSPPWESVRGLLLLTTLACGVVGLAVDVLAVTLRSPSLAALPLLALYGIPSALLPHGGSRVAFLAAGIGFLLLIGLTTRNEIHDWGDVVIDDHGPRGQGPRRTRLRNVPRTVARVAHGGRWTVAAALGLALLVPALIPGLENRLLSSSSSSSPSPGAPSGDGAPATIQVVNPILDLRRNLIDRSDTTVITYHTDATSPPPLRLAADDVFDGTTWAPSVGPLSLDQDVNAGLPTAPGLSPGVATAERTAQIDITELDSTYLPLPYPARRASVPGTWLWDADTFNVVGWGASTTALSYQVDYLDVQATGTDLVEAGPAPAEVVDRFTRLPEDLPGSISTTAREVAGTGTDAAQAQRLQRWLRSEGGFTYSEILPEDGQLDSGQDAVESFLREKVGYCVQFASAMAVMARSLGIPARVAVGFLPGEELADGSYRIRLRDAHAWPELYFEGSGWIRFEPTPSTRTGAAPAWTQTPGTTPSTEVTSPSRSTPTDSGTGAAPAPESAPGRTEGAGGQDGADGASPSTQPAPAVGSEATRWWTDVPWRTLGTGLLIIALAGLPRIVVTIRRARRGRSAGSPQERAEATWLELRERLEEMGMRWPVSWTPRTVARWLSAELRLAPTAAAALVRVVDDLERARYARPSHLSRPMGERSEDVRAIERAVARSRPRWQRVRAVIFPLSTALGPFRDTAPAPRERLPPGGHHENHGRGGGPAG
jgi:transglutaminase-like putative cysteine protease